MDKDPPPLVYARPREDNILEWYVCGVIVGAAHLGAFY